MLPTDFKEVGGILQKACPNVKDFITIHELIPYLTDFSTGTKQKIIAGIKNDGEANTCHDFFWYIGSRPSFFPKFVAALHKTHQYDVYIKILEEIKSYFAKYPKRLEEVLEMIDKEISAADYNVSNSNEPVQPFPEASGDSLVKPDALTPQINPRTVEFINTRPLQTPNSSLDPNLTKGNEQESTQAKEKTGTGAESGFLTLLPSKGTITTATDVHTNQPPVTTMAVADNGQVQTPGNDKKPGYKFLDMLNCKGFTLSFLKDLCEKNGIVEALEILNQNEVAVPNSRHSPKPADVQTLDNNMKKATDQEVPYKNMNIPVSSNKDQPSTIQSPKSDTNQTWLNDSASKGSVCSTNSFNTEDSLSSSFADVSIDHISIKGTQAIQAVGDHENKNSTPNDDQDVAQFQNDIAKNAEFRLESFIRSHEGDESLRLDNAQLMAPSSNTLLECQNTPSNDQDEAQFHKDIAKNTEFRLESFNKVHHGDDSARFENTQSELAYGNISQELHNTCSIVESSLESTNNIDSMDSNNS